MQILNPTAHVNGCELPPQTGFRVATGPSAQSRCPPSPWQQHRGCSSGPRSPRPNLLRPGQGEWAGHLQELGHEGGVHQRQGARQDARLSVRAAAVQGWPRSGPRLHSLGPADRKSTSPRGCPGHGPRSPTLEISPFPPSAEAPAARPRRQNFAFLSPRPARRGPMKRHNRRFGAGSQSARAWLAGRGHSPGSQWVGAAKEPSQSARAEEYTMSDESVKYMHLPRARALAHGEDAGSGGGSLAGP